MTKSQKTISQESIAFRVYDRHGISLAYPNNWVLDETEISDDQTTIQITNPDGAFWMLNIYRADDVDQVAQRCEEAVMAMRSEYPGLEVTPVTRHIAGRTLHGFEMHFFYLDVVCIAEALAFREHETTYCLFWLSGDVLVVGVNDDPVSTEDIFAAITHTFFHRSAVFSSVSSPQQSG